ncbi:MAG: permease-like cell division protein FtsX [Dictyoglomus thermophilum]|uniref:FtsX extracellular domain-containing protein n=1 Tax=Dictyoglomus thermophilum TaxID=14 RepID=A0A7V3ZH72_DICTH
MSGVKEFWEGLKSKGIFLYLGFIILYFVFFSLAIFITAMNGSLNMWIEKIKIYAFITPKTPDSQILKIIDDLKTNFRIKEINYITQKDAWEKLKEIIGRENDIFAWGSPDSLPKALEITPLNLDNIEYLLSFIMNYNFVEEVRYSEEMVNQWYKLNSVINYIKKLYIYLGSLAFLIISVELLAHAHLAFPNFSVSSQIWENIFVTLTSAFISFLLVFFISSFIKEHVVSYLPYFGVLFDIKHIFVWLLYFILSSIIVSFTSALMSFQRLK